MAILLSTSRRIQSRKGKEIERVARKMIVWVDNKKGRRGNLRKDSFRRMIQDIRPAGREDESKWIEEEKMTINGR